MAQPVLASSAISGILFETKLDGVATNADSTPTAVLYRNGSSSGVSVTVANVTTGLYSASWTNGAWSAGDMLFLRVTATIDASEYTKIVWIGYIDSLIDTIDLNPSTTYWLKSQIVLTSTAGTEAHLRVWMVDSFGRAVNVSEIDTDATATMQLVEHAADGGSELFSETFAKTDQSNGGWEKTIANPGFTADRMYVVNLSATVDGDAITGQDVEVVFG